MMLPLFQNRKIHFPEELRDTPDMRELMEQIKYATYTGFGCLSGDTLIDTPFGQVPIMNVQNNDSVLVHSGYKSGVAKVKNHIITGVKQTYTVLTDSGEMHLTSCHKVLTMRGYVQVKDLLNTDMIIRSSFWNNLKCTDTNGQIEEEDTINPLQKLMASEDGCIEQSMKEKLVLFLEDMKSITSMKINQITQYLILKCYHLEITNLNMLEKKNIGTIENADQNSALLQEPIKESSMLNISSKRANIVEFNSNLKKETNMLQNIVVTSAEWFQLRLKTIQSTFRYLMYSALYAIHGLNKSQQIINAVQMSAIESMKNKNEKQELKFVPADAVLHSNVKQVAKENTVAMNVKLLQETNLTQNAHAETVEKNLWQSLSKLQVAHIAANVSSIISISERKVEPVYDFEIRSTHNYVANGMVVHNSKCDDGADLISQLGMMETIAPLPDMYSDDDIEDEEDDFIEDEYGQRRSPKRFSDGVYKVKRKKDTSGNMYDLYS